MLHWSPSFFIPFPPFLNIPTTLLLICFFPSCTPLWGETHNPYQPATLPMNLGMTNRVAYRKNTMSIILAIVQLIREHDLLLPDGSQYRKWSRHVQELASQLSTCYACHTNLKITSSLCANQLSSQPS
ncbi:putative signal peptide protein [Puccinia sorghi]|uniref:Putative signal peptide protein n=1 Tax=Puccinia sorghi TaxID=27349 RepID=A0A0L6UQP7_9BASI|nr:putative signal peptide protein [Puccinia sorghi]